MKRIWSSTGKTLTAVLVVVTMMGFSSAWAQSDQPDVAAPPPIPPIPPKVPNEELPPSVVISDKEGERIEEYSRDGRVYMVKITPIRGPAYWYLDENGDGQLELQPSDADKGHGPVRPVYWKLKEW